MAASNTKKRVGLYSVSLVMGAVLLFAGFGITIPPDADTRLSGASMLASLEDYDGALAACDKVLTEHPDSVEARVFRATFLAQAKRFEESLVAYDDVLSRVESAEMKRSLRADRASVLLHAGRTKDFQAARDALAASGVDKYVHLLDGIAARKRSDWAASVKAFENVIETDAENDTARSLLIDVLVTRAKEHVAARRFEDSVRDYRAALNVDPDRVDVAFQAVEVLITLEEEQEAVRLIKVADIRNRGAAALLFRAATSLLERGEQASAMQALAIAVKSNATVTETLFDKSPAWSDVRVGKSLRELVSKQDSVSGAGLTAPGAVIGSSGQDK